MIDNESGTNAQLAQEGMRHIENAILELLFRNPQGLRNVQITNMLASPLNLGVSKEIS